MPTNAKTKTERAAQRTSQRSHAAAPDSAIALLKKDHREVEGYFEDYEDLGDDKAKGELAKKICMALKVHTQIEEEIFYPAARKATGDEDLLDEALVEHAGAKHLIGEIESMKPGDDLYDAKITVLGEQMPPLTKPPPIIIIKRRISIRRASTMRRKPTRPRRTSTARLLTSTRPPHTGTRTNSLGIGQSAVSMDGRFVHGERRDP